MIISFTCGIKCSESLWLEVRRVDDGGAAAGGSDNKQTLLQRHLITIGLKERQNGMAYMQAPQAGLQGNVLGFFFWIPDSAW
jgi:hypothetical protein